MSIILPTYNGARFLPEQIGSVLKQDDEDFELLITDDGSTDDTRSVTAELAATDARIRVIASSGNLGQNNRLAQLIGEATGDYVAICDQDDRWAPDRNRLLFAAMGDRPMAFGRSELIDGDGTAMGKSLLEALLLEPGPESKLRGLIRPMYSAHATITERGHLGVAGLWAPLPFDWMMALECLFSRGLVYVDEAVTFHRLHGGNQANHLQSDEGKYSASYFRWLFLFRRIGRLRLWLVFDFLGRSALLDSETRRLFAHLANRCQTVWFAEWRALRNDGGLRADIKEALRPLSGGTADWNYFANEIDILTSPKLGRPMRQEVRRRYQM
ncbi:glycosyltransferase [Sphingomonas guangdongensis]|uniref:glycosyltransferase n=1 Tax=Sphingomonas guangdongensis TaxID=1141890 RepID=UPI0015CE4956|nr:glycosyltransferase [Sphingomonas guangdongensis]